MGIVLCSGHTVCEGHFMFCQRRTCWNNICTKSEVYQPAGSLTAMLHFTFDFFFFLMKRCGSYSRVLIAAINDRLLDCLSEVQVVLYCWSGGWKPCETLKMWFWGEVQLKDVSVCWWKQIKGMDISISLCVSSKTELGGTQSWHKRSVQRRVIILAWRCELCTGQYYN